MFEAYKPKNYHQNFFKTKSERKEKSSRQNPRRHTPIARVSPKRQKEGKEYARLRKIFLAENPKCQIQWDDKCSKIATQVHHVKFRGKYYLKIDTWKSSCPYCHRMVTDNGVEASRRGLIIRDRNV